jgi:hypothetical protein
MPRPAPVTWVMLTSRLFLIPVRDKIQSRHSGHYVRLRLGGREQPMAGPAEIPQGPCIAIKSSQCLLE